MKKTIFIVGLLVVSLMSVVDAQDDELVEDFDDEEFMEGDGADEDFMDADYMDPPIEDDPDTEIHVPVHERPTFVEPKPIGKAWLAESFPTIASFMKKWKVSESVKEGVEEDLAKYDGQWVVDEAQDNPILNDNYLVLKSKAKHHAISTKLDRVFKFEGKPFIVQYEVKYEGGMDCGGSYIKLISDGTGFSQRSFHDKTPYTIMFGPDRCGSTNKIHFIFRHKNPKTGEYEEKHAKQSTSSMSSEFTDKRAHLLRLMITPDNKYDIQVDGVTKMSGDLLEDFEPPVNPPKEIVDEADRKPDDWDEREKIPDETATKPDDWDEDAPERIIDESASMPSDWREDLQELIPDPDAEKPADWDDEMDGTWEAALINNPECEGISGCGEWSAPEIPNPAYKGKWKAPMIANADYDGIWKPRMIPNPDYFEDLQPYKMTPIVALGLELWSMNDNIAFDNFLITDDLEVAKKWTGDTWEIKKAQQIAPPGSSVIDSISEQLEEKPWLWAVILVVVVLPLVLLIVFCCSPSNPSTPSATSAAAARKKTDEATPDTTDAPGEASTDEEEKVEEEEGSGDAKRSASNSPKKTKASLLDKKETQDADDEDVEEEKAAPVRTSPRKRTTKARKD